MKKLFKGNNRIYCLTNIFVCLLCTGYLCTGYCSINSEKEQDSNTIVVLENDADPLSDKVEIKEEIKKATETKTEKKVVVTTKKSNTSSKKYVKPSYDSVTGSAVVNYAKNYLGLRYVSGGNSLTKGTDCSGFTKLIYKEFGITLSRSVKSQVYNGKYVKKGDLQKGDLVFYGKTSNSVSHVAIYIGNGKVIHQSNPKDGVKIDPVNMMVYITARRVITKPSSTTPSTEDSNKNEESNNTNQNDSVTDNNVNNNTDNVVDNNSSNNTNQETNSTYTNSEYGTN